MVALWLSLAGCAAGDESSRPTRQAVRVGDPAPAYRIATFGGDSLIIGPSPSVVLLNVWATWCASCKEEFALMDTLLTRHEANGLRVVAVSVDVGSSEPVHRTVAEYAVTFEVAHDAEGEVERRYPALGVPASYLIGRDGQLIWKHVGVMPASVDTVIAGALAPDSAIN